jgi:diguanylate cyclase (GGDEF)-like protein
MPMDIIAPWRKGFERGETLHVPSIENFDLDPELRELMAMQGIQGILLVPLQWDGSIVGFVGFDRVKGVQQFSAETVRILVAMAGAVGTILARAAANIEIIHTRTELENAVQRLRHLAMHDDLTGAPNRRAFHLAIAEALDRIQKHHSEVCVAMIDLARFKSINEKYGHTEGDRLLRQIVRRWYSVNMNGADLFRIGGDEFGVVLVHPDAGQTMKKLIADMRSALNEPFILGDQSNRIAMRVGITVAPHDGNNVEVLAANADLALLTSKTEKEETRHFSADLRKKALQRHETAQELLASRPDHDFALVYQPIIDLRTGSIVKVEALLRWRNPMRGLLEPAEFIDVLCGLEHSRKIGRWVLETACHQIAQWNQRFSLGLIVCINAFPLQLVNSDFVLELLSALRRSGLPRHCLEIEVTENIAWQDGTHHLAVLKELSELSVSLSLDDFGTGFASLNSLTQINVQTLKIDKGFVIGLKPGDPRIEVLKAIQHMSKGLGIKSVVEGVEDREVVAMMREIGFDFGQGFHWSRPINAKSFTALLHEEYGPAVRFA